MNVIVDQLKNRVIKTVKGRHHDCHFLNVARLFHPPPPPLSSIFLPFWQVSSEKGGGYHQLVLQLVLLRAGGGGGIGSWSHCGFFASALDTNPPAPFQVDSRVNFQVD